jgi:hypothetical protein
MCIYCIFIYTHILISLYTRLGNIGCAHGTTQFNYLSFFSLFFIFLVFLDHSTHMETKVKLTLKMSDYIYG